LEGIWSIWIPHYEFRILIIMKLISALFLSLTFAIGWLSPFIILHGAESAKEEKVVGQIRGVVTFEPNPSKPWRQSRYYISDSKRGYLAETIVTLEGPGLEGIKREPKTWIMNQENFQFVPELLALEEGDSVKFTNSDAALHNVMTFKGPSPFNVNLTQGNEYVQCFKEGNGLDQPIRLSCVYHGSMRAWIYVFPHPFFVVTGKDGKFDLKDVPIGIYRLRVSHPAGGMSWEKSVSVTGRQPLDIKVSLSMETKSR